MDAKTGANIKIRQIDRRRQELVVPDLRGDDRPGGASTSASSTPRPGCSPTIPASPRPASCESKITYIDGDEGILLYRGYPIEQLAEHGDFLETCYLLLYGELPTAAQKADFDNRVTRHTMVHEQMSRFFQGFRRDAHPMAVMVGLRRRAVGLLSRLHRHLRSASADGRVDPHDRQDADARGDGLQVFGRPAVHLSEERARLRVQLPAHVLRGAVRGVQGQSGARARHGPHLHPARRPRAERLDLDGAARRLLRRQSVRLHRGRHRLPVGSGAWRRQRGGAQDAGARSARPTASRNTSSAPRTRTTASA